MASNNQFVEAGLNCQHYWMNVRCMRSLAGVRIPQDAVPNTQCVLNRFG